LSILVIMKIQMGFNLENLEKGEDPDHFWC
jgi:hypothetical protein